MANSDSRNKVTGIPPNALETEERVIGTLLLHSQAIPNVAEILKPDCFYSAVNRTIYQAILNLYVANEPIDIVSVHEELKKQGKIGEATSIPSLSKMTEITSSRSNLDYHARLILEKWILRELIVAAYDISHDAFEGKKDVFEIIEQSEKTIFNVTQSAFKKDAIHINEANKLTLEHLEKIKNKGVDNYAISTGFLDLDEVLGGLRKSESIIIAGRPSMGKTALALNIGENASQRVPTAIFSLEMSTQSLSIRHLASSSGVDSRKLQRGTFNDAEAAKLLRASKTDCNLYVDDTPSLNVIEWKSKSRRMKAEKNIGLIIIDYMQLMKGAGASRELEISNISQTIKATAKELDIPIITLSQMNRSVEQRTTKKPQLSDLRESGAIEQDADVVMFVHRPEYYDIDVDENGKSTENMAEIIIAKNRNFGVGDCKLTFQKELTKFVNYARDFS